MQCDHFNQIFSKEKIMKYREKIEKCDYYISFLNNEKVTSKQIQEMDKFSNDVYREILFDSPDIAIANTAIRRNIDPMMQELLNLKALKKMLDECIVKEGENSNGEGKEI